MKTDTEKKLIFNKIGKVLDTDKRWQIQNWCQWKRTPHAYLNADLFILKIETNIFYLNMNVFYYL